MVSSNDNHNMLWYGGSRPGQSSRPSPTRAGRRTGENAGGDREKAPPEVARILDLHPGERIFHSVLLHTDRGVPMQLADRWVHPQVAPAYLEQDFTRITPSRYLLSVAPVTEAEHVIEALRPDPRTQDLLAVAPDEPCLVLHRTTWVGTTAATHSRFTHPGSRYRIGGRFTPAAAGGPAG